MAFPTALPYLNNSDRVVAMCLQAIYDQYVAPTSGGATENTLGEFKEQNNDNLIDVISFLTQLLSEVESIKSSLASAPLSQSGLGIPTKLQAVGSDYDSCADNLMDAVNTAIAGANFFRIESFAVQPNDATFTSYKGLAIITLYTQV